MPGELDIGSIVMRIRADASGVQEGLSQLEAAMGQTKAKVQQSGAGVDQSYKKMGASAQASAAAQAAAAAAMAAAAAKAFAVIVGAIDTGIKAMNRYQAALIGVNSVAKGQGVSSAQMTQALDTVTDAFLDVASASTAFKNLLSRGYNIEQATNAIIQLKDAAAFGRQASLDLAQAVVTATEGLKNENSILVDNAGVTKNVAKMWKEYAASIGTSVDKMTQAQKIEAEVAGLRHETRFQVGDLAKLQDTLAGSQAKTALAAEKTAVVFGEAMAPAVKAVTEILGVFLTGLTELINTFPGLIAGLTAVALGVTAMLVVQKAVIAFKALGVALQVMTANVTIFGVAINSALPWLAALGAVVGIATTIYTHFNKAQQEAAEAAKKQAEVEAERKKALQDSINELTGLRDRYSELSQRTRLTYSESQEMLAIEKKLQEQYGITGGALAAQGEQYDTLTGKINETILAKLREQQIDKENAADAAASGAQAAREEVTATEARAAALRQAVDLMDQYTAATAAMNDVASKHSRQSGEYYNALGAQQKLQAALNESLKGLGMQGASGESLATAMEEAVTAAENAIRNKGESVVDAADALMAKIAGALRISGAKVSDATESTVSKAFLAFAQADPDINLDAFSSAYEDALLNMDISGAVSAMNAVKEKLVSGAMPTEADTASVKAGFETIVAFASDTSEALSLSGDQQLALIQSLAPLAAHLVTNLDGLSEVPGTVIEQWKTQNLAKFMSQSAEEMKKSAEEMSGSVQSEISAMGQIAGKLRNEKDILSALRQLKVGIETENAELVKSASEALTGLGVNAPANLQEAQKMLDRRVNIQTDYNMDMLAAYRDASAMQKEFQGKLDSLVDSGQGDSYMAVKLRSFIAMLEEAQSSVGSVFTYQGAGISPETTASIDGAPASLTALTEAEAKAAEAAEKSAAQMEEQKKQLEALTLVQQGMSSGKTDTTAYREALDYLVDFPEYAHLASGSLEDVNTALSRQQDIFSGVIAAMSGDIVSLDQLISQLKTRLQENPGEAEFLNPLISGFENAKQIYENAINLPGVPFKQGFDLATASSQQLQAELDKTTAQANLLSAALNEKSDQRAKIAGIQKVAQAQMAGKASAQDWAKAQSDAAEALGYTGDSAETMAALAASGLARVDAEMEGLRDQTQVATSWISEMLSYIANNSASVNVDTSAAVSALQGLISVYNVIAGLFGWPTASGGSSRGGGGGGGGNKNKGNSAFKNSLDALQHQVSMGRKSLQGELNALLALQKKYKGLLNAEETRDLNKRIYDAQEAVRQANLQKDLDALEHKKAMGRMSLAAEIATLQKILKAHKLNAEERREVLEQLYAAQEALRQERLNKELRRISYLTTVEKMTTAEEIKALEAVLAKHKLTTDERMDLEEQLFAARERLRSDALAWDLALLDHQIAMGQSSVEQEIARLVDIKEAHILTQEELMQIDERIYRLQNQRSQEQVNSTKTAYDQIVGALKNRLNEQKRLEDKALDERIEALNELTRAENEAKKVNDYAQSLADKQRELSVEKSARRRRELMEEIAKMEADEALRLRQLARQGEIDALKEQKDAVNEKYAQLTSEENLRQEALRLVMSNNLQEMTDLIASYGEEWKDAGGSLAEALTSGLLLNSESILATINNLTTAIQDSINDQLTSIGARIPNALAPVSGVTINISGGLTVREEADVGFVANELYRMVQAAGR